MGANQSHGTEAKWRESIARDGTLSGFNTGQGNNSAMKSCHSNVQGKPLPPQGVPTVSEVTHNSLSLSWQPPKLTRDGSIIAYMVEMFVVKDNEWVILTKSCQGNFYKVRNLESDTEYQFRVKAENIFGRSKPGNVSEIVHTSLYDVHDFCPPSDKKISVKRRHSLTTNFPVEGRVAAILNHSSPVVEMTTAKESKNTLQREGLRSSIQNSKKRSSSSLIPGTKTNSLLRLRSQSQLQNGHDFENRKEETSNRNSVNNSLEKLEINADSDTRSDLGSDCNTLSQSSSSDYFEREQLSNEKNSQMDQGINCGEKILSAPVCDDVKLAIYSKKLYPDNNSNFESDEGIHTSRSTTPDFRTLRSMLQSDVIIKPTQSLPEISDVCRGSRSSRGSARNKLAPIIDEEDDEPVRVTTL